LDPIPEKEIEDVKETSNFKSKLKRNAFLYKKDNVPPVGSYKLD